MVKFAGLVSFPAFVVVVGLLVGAWLVAAIPLVRRRWPEARGEVGAVGGLTALFALFFWRVLFERGVSVPRGGGDFNSFYYPLAAFAAEQIAGGHFPLWNPHLFAGAPFAADYQTGALYPINLLVWAVAQPYTYGTFTATVIFHVWWASVATYGFARTLGLGRTSAILAGVVFAYSGFMTAQLGHAPMIAVASWLPAILAALHRGRRGGPGGVAWAVLAGAGLTMAILAGHPQITLYVGLTAVAYALYLAWEARPAPAPPLVLVRGSSGATLTALPPVARRGRWHDPPVRHWAGALTRLAVTLGVAGGLAAPLLLPAAQLARRSIRATISYEGATEYSLRPVALVQLVLPKVFGDNPTNYFYSNIFSGETWGYAGVVTLVLAAVGVLRRFDAGRRFFAALGAVALLGALGPFTPLHGWLYGFVPGFESIRAAGRLLLLYDFAVALLAAWGLDALLAWLRDARVSDAATAATAAAHSVVFGVTMRRVRRALLLAIGTLALFVIPLFYSLVLGRDDPVGRPVIALDGLNVLLLLLVAAAGLLWAVERRRVTPHTLATFALLLVVFDLFGATIGFNPTTDDVQAGFTNDTVRRELRARTAGEPPFRVDTDDVSDRYQPSAPLLVGADTVSGAYNPLGLADYAALRERAQSSRSSTLYGLLNVAYVAQPMGQPGDKPAPRDWTRAFAGDRVAFYQPSRPPLPRAFVVPAAEEVSGPGPAFDRIKSPDFDPAKVVYLQAATQPTAADSGASAAVVTRGDTESVTVAVTTTGAGYLLLAETYYPGWEATLNGRPTPVLQADLAFRAVYLPGGGEHTVVFRFVPAPWAYGWLIAGVTAAVALALLVGAAILSRRGR